MLFRLLEWSQKTWARLPAALPSSCALCGRDSDAAVCEECRTRFFTQPTHRCPCCAIPLAGKTDTRCGECLKQPPAFDATIVAADYAPPVDHLVLALKFGSRLELAPLFAHMLRDAMLASPHAPPPQQLTAVPLGPQRLAERGFNQALEIARPLSRATGITLHARMVSRLRDTRAQALLHPDERRKNMRNAFIVAPEAMPCMRGSHVGVIDDVMTTGETLNELATTLKRFGAARVTNLVFARTLPK